LELQSVLSLRNYEFALELSSMAEKIEEVWKIKFTAVHNQHMEDLERITNDANKTHSDEIARVKCELEASHREEIDRLHLEHSDEIARVSCDSEASHREEIDRLNLENKNLSLQVMKINDIMRQNLEAIHAEHDRMNMEVQKFSSSYEKMAAENESLKAQLKISKVKGDELMRNSQGLESTNTYNTTELKKLMFSLKEVTELNRGLERRIKEVSTANRELDEVNNANEDKICELLIAVKRLSTSLDDERCSHEMDLNHKNILLEEREAEKEHLEEQLQISNAKNDDLKAQLQTLVSSNKENLHQIIVLEESVRVMEGIIDNVNIKIIDIFGELKASQDINAKLTRQMKDHRNNIDDFTKCLTVKTLAFEETTATITALRENASATRSQLSAEVYNLLNGKNILDERVTTLRSRLSEKRSSAKELERLLDIAKNEIAEVIKFNADLNKTNHELQTSLSKSTSIKEEQATALNDTHQTLQKTLDERNDFVCRLFELQAKYDSIKSYSYKAEQNQIKDITQLKATTQQKDDEAFALNNNIFSLISRIASLDDESEKIKSEKDEFVNMLKSAAQELSSTQEKISDYPAYGFETSVEPPGREREESHVDAQKSLFDKDIKLLSMCSHIQELEKQLHSKTGDVLNMTEKLNHFQQLAGKLAVSVLKLKMKCRHSKDPSQLISQLETQNEKIAMLERCLNGVKADRQALAATHFHQHKKLTATTADLRKKMLDELLRRKIDHLQSENHSLLMESTTAKLKMEQKEDALIEAQAVKSAVENRLEAAMQQRSHLTDEVDSMRNTITMLQAGKKSLLQSLRDYQDKITFLTNKVTMLENQAASNENKILKVEAQLELKISEAGESNNQHEATITELRNQIASQDRLTSGTDEVQSSLKSKMVRVSGDRKGIALQLDKHVAEPKQLNDKRRGRAAMVTGNSTVHKQDHGINPLAIFNDDSEAALYGVHLEVTPQTDMNSISEGGVSIICSRNQAIITQIEYEKKLLKEEIKLLRAGLEQALQELAVVKTDCRSISRVARKARTLLEKTENEKTQLVVYLDDAQQTLKRIQGNSSQLRYEHDEQFKSNIIKQTIDLREKNESTKMVATQNTDMSADIDRNDTRNEIPPNNITGQGYICLIGDNCPKVTSHERFTIEKGQSMLDLLKEIKKSGRKQKMKYRRDENKL
jgi:chromosome segregation ATPase